MLALRGIAGLKEIVACDRPKKSARCCSNALRHLPAASYGQTCGLCSPQGPMQHQYFKSQHQH